MRPIHFNPPGPGDDAPDPPQPPPTPTPKAAFKINWTIVAVVTMLLLQFWNHWPVPLPPSPVPTPTPVPPGPNPPAPVPDSAALLAGRAWKADLLASEKAGFDAAAAKLRSGATISDSAAESRAVSEAARKATFAKAADPVIAVIVKPGAEPATPADREALAKAFEDLGKGLVGGP